MIYVLDPFHHTHDHSDLETENRSIHRAVLFFANGHMRASVSYIVSWRKTPLQSVVFFSRDTKTRRE